MSSSTSASDLPPPPNPFLTAYEGFVERTPLVTRWILTAQAISYLASWFVDPSLVLANVPQLTALKLQLHRLVLSPLVNTSLASLALAAWSFSDHGRRLEHSMGSSGFGWLCLSIGILSNAAFLVLCLALDAIDPAGGYMTWESSGFWIIMLGVLAVECVEAPRDVEYRVFFFVSVPALYCPLALFGLLSLLSATFSFAHVASLALGYAFGFGYLDCLKLTPSTAKLWEGSCLSRLTGLQGWVVGHAAVGADAWSENAATKGTVRKLSVRCGDEQIVRDRSI
jgi:membrane associated rhomboid family serine protease